MLVGLFCFWTCTWLKGKFKYDDSLDAFGVHGMGGTLGAILTGLFATRCTGATASLDTAPNAPPEGMLSIPKGTPLGLFEGGTLIVGQIAAVVITWVLAALATFIILKVLDAVMGLRVTEQDEVQGLDLTQHGEEGYIFI